MKGVNCINFLKQGAFAFLLCVYAVLFSGCSNRVTKAIALYEKGEFCLDQNTAEYYTLSQKYFGKAVKQFTKSAKRGNAEAQYRLGVCYEMCWGVECSSQDALKWFRLAAEQGHIYAQFKMGFYYENGFVVEPSIEEAAKWYRKAAEQGDAESQNKLGWFYENGFGVEKSYDEAYKWYGMAARQGHFVALNNLDSDETKLKE